MMNNDKIKLLKDKFNQIIDDNNKIKSRLSYLRLSLFIIGLVFFILYFTNKDFTIYLAILSTILFIVTSVIHHKYLKIVENTNYKQTVLKQYQVRFNDSYRNSSDSGNDLKSDKYIESDLDLFGKASLFGYLSFAKTPYGRHFLANAIKGNIISESDLKARQEAIQELAQDLDQTVDILAQSIKFSQTESSKKTSNVDNAINMLEHETKINCYKFIISALLTILFIASIILVVLKKVNSYLPLIIIFVNYFTSKLIFTDITKVSKDLNVVNNMFYGYDYLIDSISRKTFKSNLLNDYQAKINKLNSKSIKSFNVIANLVSTRNNIIFQVLFNGTFLIDGYLLFAYKKWQNKYQNDFKDAILSIGHFEELLSLATIQIVKKDTCIPTISNSFEFSDIKHPLITEEKCIENSFKFEGTNIITGSNMSGKTTFMRAIGVNYLLFLAGASVNAKEFSAPISKLFTSMKVVDDVNNNISTFYGEILRVKAICENMKEDQNMIVLVDEIFKGTNTLDRITGATEVVNKLIKSNVYAIITTHDYELCDINGVNNYYFLEHYEDDKIMFDYKIRKGISNTRNAIYLLKMAGVIDK